MKRTFLPLLCLLIFLLGCSTTQVYRLTDKKLPKNQSPESIELYIGKVQRPHFEIAVIDSRSYGTKADKVKKRQLQDLRRLAGKLGADAVHDIRVLQKNARGMILDERVPFPAWKQGEYKLYFLRGTAIKFTPESSPEESTKAEKMANN